MGKDWWLVFAAATFIGYQMKILAMSDFTHKVSAIDGGLMLGSVAFFLVNLGKSAMSASNEKNLGYQNM